MFHLLVIDDDKNIRFIIQTVFKNSKRWRVSTASSGHEGVAAALSDKPDAILCDVTMRDLDGPETLSLLRQKGLVDTPVIWLTGRVDRTAVNHLSELGVAGIITKPFEIFELESQIERILKLPE
jgi:DNA-binding response OmpR family regulator